jgi:dihydrofolate synthase/folylpolyglutamate synthase
LKYGEALAYLEELNRYGIVPGLKTVGELCRRLGNPQDALRFVHIAGTNGKGSVLSYLSSVLIQGGYRTGCYISPVIFDYRERIQVGGRPIPKTALCEGVERVRQICGQMAEDGLPHPTAFEAETALAFWYFRRKQCDVVVLEAGMGGREDATNIVRNTAAAVLTSVSKDHMKFLGDSLREITLHKVGIIQKPREIGGIKNICYLITCGQEPEVMKTILAAVREAGGFLDEATAPVGGSGAGEATAPVWGNGAGETAMPVGEWVFPERLSFRVASQEDVKRIRYGLERQRFDYGGFRDLEIGLAGKHQIGNAVLAVETLAALGTAGFPVSETALRRGLREAKWAGRFTVIGKKPFFVIDGAHNEAAAKCLGESIECYFTNKRMIYIIGMLRDKECEKVLALTCRYADQLITVAPPGNPRAVPAYELACMAARFHPRVTTADSLEEAVEMSDLLAGKEDVILAFGSLSYLGKLKELVHSRKKKAMPSETGGWERNARS